MKTPLVSILVPNYNKAPYLKESLDSVLAQTYKNWECIIVDDHSTDSSWEILEEYVAKDKRFKVYKRPDNRKKGGNAARNYAFEMAQGEYINWFDSDDVLDENFLFFKVASFFNHQYKFDFIISNIHQIDDNNYKLPVFERLDYENLNRNLPLDYIKGSFWIQTAQPLFKKEYLLNFDILFNENLKKGQEAEFFTRLFLQNPRFIFEEKSIVYWRLAQGSITNSHFKLQTKYQYLISYLSYKLIFKNFKKIKGKVNKTEKLFFRNVFNDMLLFLPLSSKQFWDLFYFGTVNNLFKGRFQGIKILGIRFLKGVKLI
ncbi:glycosyltransferase family 2 protein [Echinicola marina]|uniref:glycosyltransferase family 2 protein n=1 Tax=Echinicola marina TaxID=2859768 RepID=UPI001CF66A07|nr:glycosyltransferase family 2 protein [Echinicola marina]UCS91990.1 glycosyltransferase family 2 protein [Echinicola marina]